MARVLVGNIKGAPGDAGVSPTIDAIKVNGVTTLTIKDAEGTEEVQIADGANGKDGADGATGKDGADGKDGSDGVGIASMEVTQLTDADVVVDIWLTDNTNKQFGLSAPQGKDGATGPAGADGKTAYAYAQDGGYTGTEAEFGEKLAEPAPKALHVIIFDNGDGTGTADKTFGEIKTAYDNGSSVLGRIDTNGYLGVISNLMTHDELGAFMVSGIAADGAYWAAMVTESEGTMVGNVPLIPTSLPNPNALTINGTVYDGSSAVNMSLAKKENGFFYIEGTGSTAGTWLGAHSDITAYYPGLTVLYKVPVAGASATTLNINGLGAVPVVRNATTAISTTCPVNSVVMLTYTVDSGTAYWKRADYDANTKTTTGTSNKTGTKLFLTDATSQTSSGTTTYSNSNVYIGTNNRLYSGGEVVPNVDEINALIQTQLGVIENGSY